LGVDWVDWVDGICLGSVRYQSLARFAEFTTLYSG
jgi:hypothetical protein